MRNLSLSLSSVSSRPAATTDRGHPQIIRLELRELSQLFNSMDPSPFIERDLDDDAEEFIVEWAQELPSNAPVRLRIYLQQWPAEDPKDLITQAVHNYFTHRAQITRLEFRRLLRQGRTSLSIGLLFLAACLVMIQMVLADRTSAWAGVLRESLTIAGWVAMWRPMEIYLYDWWPLRQTSRTYSKLSHMPVEVTQHRKSEPLDRGLEDHGALRARRETQDRSTTGATRTNRSAKGD